MSVILIALPACVKEDSSAKEAESKLNQILKDETEKFIVAHVSRESRDTSQLFFIYLITYNWLVSGQSWYKSSIYGKAGSSIFDLRNFLLRSYKAHFLSPWSLFGRSLIIKNPKGIFRKNHMF